MELPSRAGGLAGTPWPYQPLILVVEDDDANRRLLSVTLERAGYRVVAVADGEVGYQSVAEHAPDLVVLDVGLPMLNGYELTRRLRLDPRRATLPILLLTGHGAAVEGLDAGADDFLRKPFDRDELMARIRSALRLRRALVGMEAAHAVVMALAGAVAAKDAQTEHHCQRLAHLASRLAGKIGLPDHELDAVAYGALLHDVGKIGVPESVLTKPGPLDEQEWAQMREHPGIGERICRPLAAFVAFGPIIRHHHERWDGSGYPDRLKGEAIPIGARVVGIVDAFDAMTHERPYRGARSVQDALGEIVRCAGKQFDPSIVPLFVEELTRGPGPATTQGDVADETASGSHATQLSRMRGAPATRSLGPWRTPSEDDPRQPENGH